MKIQIRTKDDLVKLLSEGVSAAWRVNKGRLNSITGVEIFNFKGNAKIVGAFDTEKTKVLDNGRVAVAFKDATIETCEFKWVGQNPIKYKSGNNEEVELMEDEVEDESDLKTQLEDENPNQSLYEICSKYTDEKLLDLEPLLKEIVFENAFQGKKHNFNLTEIIQQVNRTYGELCWFAVSEPFVNMESHEYYSINWGELLEGLSEEATKSSDFKALGEYINDKYQPFFDGERAEQFAIEMYSTGIESAYTFDDILWFTRDKICGEYFENEELVYDAGRKAIALADSTNDYLKICFDDNLQVTYNEDILKEVIEILKDCKDEIEEDQLEDLRSNLIENEFDDLLTEIDQIKDGVNDSTNEGYRSYSLVKDNGFSEHHEFINFIKKLEYNPSENAEAIIKSNPIARDLIEVLEIYVQSLLDRFDHQEDAFRDFCDPLIQSNYFEEFHAPAYEYDTGGQEYISDSDDDNYERISFDVLKAFFKLNAEDSNLAEDKQKEFAYAMLECFVKDEEDELSIPYDLMDNFEDYMIDKLEYVADRIGME